MESYLIQVENFYDRSNLTKFRTSAHELEIELGRKKGIPRHERHCKLSMNVDLIEDEDHLLHKCDLYSSIRKNTLGVHSASANFIIFAVSNFMDFLNYIDQDNNTNYIILAGSQIQKITKHPDQSQNMAQDHGINSATKHCNEPSLATILSRTIAKFVTLCFSHRKKFSSITIRTDQQ